MRKRVLESVRGSRVRKTSGRKSCEKVVSSELLTHREAEQTQRASLVAHTVAQRLSDVGGSRQAQQADGQIAQ
jgi:hypothetical protein